MSVHLREIQVKMVCIVRKGQSYKRLQIVYHQAAVATTNKKLDAAIGLLATGAGGNVIRNRFHGA
jgi:hypothetical protein